MKKLSRILVYVLALATLILSACAGAAAPVGTSGGSKVEAALVEFTGVIESMDGNQWVVNGQTITVDPAVVNDGPFNIGDTIKVEAQVAVDGSITVTRVESPSADVNSNDDNGIDDNSNDSNDNDGNSNDDNGNDDNSNGDDDNEVVGVVTAMDEATITIDGQVFNLAADFTEIKDTIQVNDTVKLHLIVNADGTMTVSEVELSDSSAIGDGNENDDNSNDDNSNDSISDDDDDDDDDSGSGGSHDDDDDDDGGDDDGGDDSGSDGDDD